MLHLSQSSTSDVIVVTLNEKRTIESGCYYLFVFTHSVTKQTVTQIFDADIDDASTYPQRYNQFTINTSQLFEDKPTGEWLYEVYEQESDSNTDPTLATSLVEQGKLSIAKATPFTYTENNASTTYKQYAG